MDDSYLVMQHAQLAIKHARTLLVLANMPFSGTMLQTLLYGPPSDPSAPPALDRVIEAVKKDLERKAGGTIPEPMLSHVKGANDYLLGTFLDLTPELQAQIKVTILSIVQLSVELAVFEAAVLNKEKRIKGAH